MKQLQNGPVDPTLLRGRFATRAALLGVVGLALVPAALATAESTAVEVKVYPTALAAA